MRRGGQLDRRTPRESSLGRREMNLYVAEKVLLDATSSDENLVYLVENTFENTFEIL